MNSGVVRNPKDTMKSMPVLFTPRELMQNDAGGVIEGQIKIKTIGLFANDVINIPRIFDYLPSVISLH